MNRKGRFEIANEFLDLLLDLEVDVPPTNETFLTLCCAREVSESSSDLEVSESSSDLVCDFVIFVCCLCN
jgi:hypothetical protein